MGSNPSESLRGTRLRLKRSDGRSRAPRVGRCPAELTAPRKVKALRREGPKRGARELFRIIEMASCLVNTGPVRKYPVRTVDNMPSRGITGRKNLMLLSARENKAYARGQPSRF